jgi:hypothetical protein
VSTIRRMILYTVFLSAPAYAADRPAPPDTIPLADVIAQVTDALQEYQKNRGSGATQELPPLSSAEFDFKTTTSKTAGLSISLFIFKFGASHEKDVVNDVTYTYSLPEPKKGPALQGSHPPPSLKDQLAQTLQSAAKAVKESSTAAGLPFSKLTVNLSYGVKWDINAEGKPQISFVTLGLTGDASKNTVQSVKVTFGK